MKGEPTGTETMFSLVNTFVGSAMISAQNQALSEIFSFSLSGHICMLSSLLTQDNRLRVLLVSEIKKSELL